VPRYHHLYPSHHMHQAVVPRSFPQSMRDFAESSGDGFGDIIEDDEESGIPGPDYASCWRNFSDCFVERMILIVPW